MELNIKREPSVEYVLIIPKGQEVKTENNPFGIKKCSVNLRQFDAEWKDEAKIHGIYNTCKKCEFITQFEKELKDHKTECSKGRECEYCRSKFQDRKSFLAHTSVKPIECLPCKAKFKCRRLWMKHKKEHHKDGFMCDRCSYKAKSKRLLDEHYGTHAKNFYCGTCDGRFSFKRELKRHEMQHRHGAYATVEVSFDCTFCKQKFRTPIGLSIHKSYSHRSKSYECDFCGKMFRRKCEMMKHLESHVEEQCEFCGKKLIKRKMPDHVNREHIKSEKSMSCKDCGKRFLKKFHFNKHINSWKTTECPSCQISFKCLFLFKRHEKEQHPEGFKCSQCSQVSKSPSILRQHLKTHTKPFSCDSCHKKFAHKCILESHQQFHQHGAFANVKVEVLQCDECEKDFQTKATLRAHKYKSHGPKRLECDICGKRFNFRTGLIKHFEAHIVEKCDICGLKQTKSKMPNHLLRKHSKANWCHQCMGCGASYLRKQSLSNHVNARRKTCLSCQIDFSCFGLWLQHRQKIHQK